MKATTTILAVAILAISPTYAQNNTVDSYIQKGLKENLALKQQNFDLQKASYALKEARGLFYPTLSFRSDYFYSSGGRTVDLPLGDLMNPVYSTLNQLTGTNNFQNIANQKFNLNANDFYDHRLSVTLPLVNAEIYISNKIRKEAINQKQAEVMVYKRSLVKDIKTAYYNSIMASNQIEIFKNAAKLLQENYKLTESRVKNGKALKGNALRILSDINDNQAKLAEAENNLKTANAYLNFLTNTALTDKVAIDTTGFRFYKTQMKTPSFETSGREEITALKSALTQAEYNISLEKASYFPTINTSLNLGYQNNYLKFDPDDRYLTGIVSLKWDLFTGFQTRNRVKIAKTEATSLNTQLDETEKQFQLQLTTATNELDTAEAQFKSAKENLQSLEEYYRETKARYDQGLVLLVELNDAFTQLINGQLAFEQSNTNVLIKLAEVERTAASYQF
ncbi:outer membrane protein TolC [Flavobacterium endophyticum]|uniref:Outer membrane protein TolC n=1 Tax=Flavobacterium endophyticum TaxID=1540163 RepID=A0A495M1N8_9FLAO|nr:TolC family protein [Flavobacterium endophyticum]RKS19040.1 outer membrane protein TolC [Flavobacterium endophyticum]